ncbi:MAG: ABC transporter substrate-binding protein [Promethearchaeota archaeon]
MKRNRISIIVLFILCLPMFIYSPMGLINQVEENPIMDLDKLELAPSGNVRLRLGVVDYIGGNEGNWDPAISTGGNRIYDYGWNTLEKIVSGNANFTAGTSGDLVWEEWKPILCTDWVVEYWPEEINSLGFKNRDGIKAIDFTLRENVKFHDGSDWNATVMKWNIDRLFMISGNLTGNGDLTRMTDFWFDAQYWEDYITPSHNFSSYIGHNSYYNGLNTSQPQLVGQVPIVKQVLILENKTSGGQVRVEWNSWNQGGLEAIWVNMISMHTYKDYYDKAIYGWDNDDPFYPDHLIGTGAYKYLAHDETIGRGTLGKFANYWNKSALEGEGWYNIDYIDFIHYDDKITRNAALYNHSVDFAYDDFWNPIDYDYVIADPQLQYLETGVSEHLTQITLNCINETWWAWPGYDAWRKGFYSDTETSGGIPRALRKAMNYAFDYDAYINGTLNGRAVRTGGLVGIDNIYYNSSAPIPDFNLTHAREILLTTEADISGEVYTVMGAANGYSPDPDLYNFSKMCADRGLTASSLDVEWQTVAITAPIFTLNFFWDDAHEGLKNVLQSSLRNIGIALVDKTGATNKVNNSIWYDCVNRYWYKTFDGTHSTWSANAWPLDYYYPRYYPGGYVNVNYQDNEEGRWRTQGGAGLQIWWPGWNFAFCYNEEVDFWLEQMFYSNHSRKLECISNISKIVQNQLYPVISISQYKNGWVNWEEWEVVRYWGWHSYALTKFVGEAESSGSPIKFKFGTRAGPNSLDPHDAWDYDSWNVFDQVVETLFVHDLSTPELNIIPWLAADYGTWSADGLRYFVQLREGVIFHDGTPFNKAAVKWNFDRLNHLMSNHTEPSRLSSLYRWPNGTKIINSVNIYNATHIEFVLNHKFAPFEALLCASGSKILSPHSTPPYDYIELLTGVLVGTGPFKYNEYIEDVEVRFEKFDNYWGGAADIDELIFTIIPDSQDRTQALLDGEIDFINTPDRTMLQKLRDNSEITLGGTHSDTTIWYLGMNNQLIPVHMRKAISYTVDYYRIIEELMNGEAVRLKSPLPLGIRYFNWGFNVSHTNITIARKALIDSGMYSSLPGLYDDEGWITRADTNPLASYNFSYWWGPDDPRMTLVNILQENLEKIGVKVLEENITGQEFLRRAAEDKNLLELFYSGWGADYNDPYNYINSFFSNDGNWNSAQFSNATVQGWIDSAESELDPGIREFLYDKIQQSLVEENFPWCWLFVARNHDAFNNKFVGFLPNPLEKVWFHSVQLSVLQIKSNWLVNEVNLDGVISLGEWDETIAYDISLNRTWGWPNRQSEPSSKVLTVRFKNDEDWLYILYEIPKAQLETAPEWAGIEGFWEFFSDSGVVELGGTTRDEYGWDGTQFYNDIYNSGYNNVEGTGSYDDIYYRFEFRKELNSGDPLDWSYWPGEMMGNLIAPKAFPQFFVLLYDSQLASTFEQYVTIQLSRQHLISNWLTNGVTLDGVVSAGEWTDTIPYNVSLYQAGGWPSPFYLRSNKVPTIRFKNDGEWLYGLYEIEWPGPESGPEQAGLGSSGFLGNSRTQSDGASVGISGWTDDRYGFDGYRWYTDEGVSGQNDMEGIGVKDVNHYLFEFRKRLDSNDGWDWDLNPGGTLGDSFGPPWFWVAVADWDTGFTYIQYLMLQLTSGTIQITSDYNLTSDIYFGSENGFEIGADGITLDGNGYKIMGNGSGTGVLNYHQDSVTIKNLTIQEFGAGISIYDCQENNITLNYISDNFVGLNISATNNNVTNNIIARNNLGVILSDHSNYVYRNLLINNDQQISNVSGNVWVDPINNVGNFWSNYWGEDLDGDYIGDTNLSTNGHEGVDYRPLLDPSIPEGYAPYALPYADWWMWGRGGSPVTIQGLDPYGRIISVDVNEIGLNAFYIENDDVDPGEASVMILIAINPEDPILGIYSFEVIATEEATEDTNYSLTVVFSGNNEIIDEFYFEEVPINEEEYHEINMITEEVEDPEPGESPVIVEPGDVIMTSFYAPIVDVSQPEVSEHIFTTSVEVVGIATDDTGVGNITVNGVEVPFTSTGNPLNEVSFSTTVENLEVGENVITINVTDKDTVNKSTTVQRTVIVSEETDLVPFILYSLQDIIETNPETPLAEELEDVLEKTEIAYEELIKDPPDYLAFVGDLEKAIADLEELVMDGLLDPNEGEILMDLSLAIARNLAMIVINEAMAHNGDQDKIEEALEYIDEGDILRELDMFKDSVDKYKDALAKAESLLP